MPEVTLKKIKSGRAACVDVKGFEAMKPAFGEISQYILSNVLKSGEPPGIVVYGNSPAEVGWENCIYKVCIPVKGRSRPSADRVRIETLPAIKAAACITYKGPYDGLPDAWGKVYMWIHANGYKPAAVGREAYLNDCDVTPPEELLTEVQVPVVRG